MGGLSLQKEKTPIFFFFFFVSKKENMISFEVFIMHK